jgi:hypothetical protein
MYTIILQSLRGITTWILHIIVIFVVPFIYFIRIFYFRRNARAFTIVFTPSVARALSPLEVRNLCFVASHGHLPSSAEECSNDFKKNRELGDAVVETEGKVKVRKDGYLVLTNRTFVII